MPNSPDPSDLSFPNLSPANELALQLFCDELSLLDHITSMRSWESDYRETSWFNAYFTDVQVESVHHSPVTLTN